MGLADVHSGSDSDLSRCFAARLLHPRLCCKTIFSTPARKIDSRSCSQPQHRFKSARSRIRLFQIPIPQTWIGDFCNTIPPAADKLGAARMTLSRVRQEAGKE